MMQTQALTGLKCQLSQPFVALRFVPASVTAADFSALDIRFPQFLHDAVPKRVAEYLAGRLCAQQALLQLGIRDVQTASGENRAPLWPAGVRGTITHSHDLAMAMVAQSDSCLGIGVDIEHFLTPQQEFELQGTVLHPLELLQFSALKHQIRCPLTLIFSAKESIFKALYPLVHQYFDFKAAALTGFDKDTLFFVITDELCELVPVSTRVMVHYQVFDGWLLTECQF